MQLSLLEQIIGDQSVRFRAKHCSASWRDVDERAADLGIPSI